MHTAHSLGISESGRRYEGKICSFKVEKCILLRSNPWQVFKKRICECLPYFLRQGDFKKIACFNQKRLEDRLQRRDLLWC